jgi:hypothetical protein
MTWGSAMRAAFGSSASRGRWWLVALAAFLVRGGLVALLPAILVLPTPAQLALGLNPSLTGDAPGDVTPALIELAVRLFVSATLVLLVTTLIGARLEGELVEAATDATALEPPAGRRRLPLGRAVVARLVTHLPTLVAIVLGGAALAQGAYAELLSPSSTGSLVIRVAARSPLAIATIVAAWLLGESWGGLAIRRLVAGEAFVQAVGRAFVGVVRPSGLATLVTSSVAVGLPMATLALASARAYDRLWPLVVDRADPWAVAIALGLLVVTWAAGLWLLGIGLAFRSAAWTVEGLRETGISGPRPAS